MEDYTESAIAKWMIGGFIFLLTVVHIANVLSA